MTFVSRRMLCREQTATKREGKEAETEVATALAQLEEIQDLFW